MFRPAEYADGGTSGEPQGPPNVYVPQPDPPPAYDAYADPAAAHGWQDVYGPADAQADAHTREATPGTDDTRELPPVPTRGRSGAGRHSRRGRGSWRARRVMIVAGAVGAVSATALIAGIGLSDAPSGGAREGGGRRSGPAAGESPKPPSTGTGRTPAPGAPLTGRPVNSDEPSGAASASPSTAASPTPSEPGTDAPIPSAGTLTAGTPAAGTPSAGTPTPSAPAAASPPGWSGGKPGRGPGGTKGPK